MWRAEREEEFGSGTEGFGDDYMIWLHARVWDKIGWMARNRQIMMTTRHDISTLFLCYLL